MAGSRLTLVASVLGRPGPYPLIFGQYYRHPVQKAQNSRSGSASRRRLRPAGRAAPRRCSDPGPGEPRRAHRSGRSRFPLRVSAQGRQALGSLPVWNYLVTDMIRDHGGCGIDLLLQLVAAAVGFRGRRRIRHRPLRMHPGPPSSPQLGAATIPPGSLRPPGVARYGLE